MGLRVRVGGHRRLIPSVRSGYRRSQIPRGGTPGASTRRPRGRRSLVYVRTERPAQMGREARAREDGVWLSGGPRSREFCYVGAAGRRPGSSGQEGWGGAGSRSSFRRCPEMTTRPSVASSVDTQASRPFARQARMRKPSASRCGLGILRSGPAHSHFVMKKPLHGHPWTASQSSNGRQSVMVAGLAQTAHDSGAAVTIVSGARGRGAGGCGEDHPAFGPVRGTSVMRRLTTA
jgi:hypothetical protein